MVSESRARTGSTTEGGAEGSAGDQKSDLIGKGTGSTVKMIMCYSKSGVG